jgi:hypothetical protein
MGKKQRDTGLMHLSDADLSALRRAASTPPELKLRCIAEEKFRRLRNKQKQRSNYRP